MKRHRVNLWYLSVDGNLTGLYLPRYVMAEEEVSLDDFARVVAEAVAKRATRETKIAHYVNTFGRKCNRISVVVGNLASCHAGSCTVGY